MQAEWIFLAIIVFVICAKLFSTLGKQEVPVDGQLDKERLLKMVLEETKAKAQKKKEFDSDNFLIGAKMAFHQITQQFALGDLTKVKNILSEKIFKKLSEEVEKRKKDENQLEFSLISFQECRIISPITNLEPEKIEVEFITEQINALKNKAGQVIEGDSINLSTIKDLWVFEKKGKNNWVLLSTKSEVA